MSFIELRERERGGYHQIFNQNTKHVFCVLIDKIRYRVISNLNIFILGKRFVPSMGPSHHYSMT